MLGITPRSLMKFFNHVASFVYSLVAIFADSHIEFINVVYLELFHVNNPPFSNKTQPNFEHELSLSVLKLASV